MNRDLITKSQGDPYNERLFFRNYPFNKITYTKIERSPQNRPIYALYAFNLIIDRESQNFYPFKKINYIQSEADLSDPRLSKDVLFRQIQDTVQRGQTSTAIIFAISYGIKDKNVLTDLIFHARHPERRGKRIQGNEQALVKEWWDIKNRLVEPAISSTMYSGPSKHSTAVSPLPASPIPLRHVAPTVENALKLMKYLGNILKVPWRLGYVILQHEIGIRGFKHPDGVMQSTRIARNATIPLIPRQVKILLLGLDPTDPKSDKTLDSELHNQFGSQLAVQIAVGLQELKQNLQKFNGYVALTYAAYNGGAGRIYQIITQGKSKSRPAKINSEQWEEMCRRGASLLHQLPNEVKVNQGKWGCDANIPAWYRLIMIYDKTTSIRLWSYQYLRSVRCFIRKQKPAYQCNWKVHGKIEECSGDIIMETSREGALDKLYHPEKLGKYFTIAPQELSSIPEDTLPLKAIDHQLYKVKKDGSAILLSI
jgi:hypothetical protein